MADLIDYQITLWTNGSGEAINSTNLLNIENGIDRVAKAVQNIENNPFVLEGATPVNLGGVKVDVVDNGDGSFTGKFWTS